MIEPRAQVTRLGKGTGGEGSAGEETARHGREGRGRGEEGRHGKEGKGRGGEGKPSSHVY